MGTSNSKDKVGEYLMNRPGRLFDFLGINWELINAYLEENLKDKTHIKSVLAIAVLMSEPNFDMIKALVEEMNRYEESPFESLQFLNIRPQFNDKLNFKTTVVDPEGKSSTDIMWRGNPMTEPIKLEKITVAPEYFMKVDAPTKSLIFLKDGYTVKLKNFSEAEFSWSKFGESYSKRKASDDKSCEWNKAMRVEAAMSSSSSNTSAE